MYRISAVLLGFLVAVPFAPALAAAPVKATQDVPGMRFSIAPSDLPAPYATPAEAVSAERIGRPDAAVLRLPPGFHANLFAAGLDSPRWLAVAPNGDVFLSEPRSGKVTLLRDADGDGKAEKIVTFASGFARPHGLAFHDGALYVSDTRAVWRVQYKSGALRGGETTRITKDGIGGSGNHWATNIAFSPKGQLFVAIGSAGNVDEEALPRASVQLVTAGGKLETFASGLRNPVGIAFYPGTDDLYTVVNERDGLGDDLPPDYLTRIRKGDFFGWPYAYIGPHPDPDYGKKRPDLVKATKTPDVLFQAHSAPLGLVFYTGTKFPVEYRGNAFVSLHGSWNKHQPTGYKIVRVKFRDSRPENAYENFATGFRAGTSAPARVYGRPVGLAIAKDGSLLIADDTGKAVWRISYEGKK